MGKWKRGAGLAAAKDNYIPDIIGLARYSYQSGVPLLTHNFGTFGFTMSYVLFDGGRRSSEVKESRTLRSQAEINLTKVQEEVAVQGETAYDMVEQLQSMVRVAEEAYKVRVELARLSDRQYEQDVVLASTRAGTNAKSAAAKPRTWKPRLDCRSRKVTFGALLEKYRVNVRSFTEFCVSFESTVWRWQMEAS
jgi:outer membrane protein TolC